MRLLLIHARKFGFRRGRKALKEAEEGGLEEGEYENVLVVFIAVEKNDSRNLDGVVERTAKEIMDVYSKVKAERVLIYPYAHISSELSDPSTALIALRKLEDKLMSLVECHRAPFGWYKEFSLECFGHPLAELSRSIAPPEPKREEREKVKEKYLILMPDGSEMEPENYLRKYPDGELASLVEKEALKRGLEGGRKPHYLDYCRKFGIEWEPASDLGHMRYGPEGSLIFRLIAEYSRIVVNELGIPVLEVNGTNMFDLSVPAVRQHAELFGDRLYEVDVEDRQYVLRYAACHQQFSMMKDWTISYRNLPLGSFEVADSYRLEQSGELLLCFRVRKLHMPDLHILCRDLDEAMEMTLKVHDAIWREAEKIGRRYVSIYNTTEGFYRRHKEYFMRLLRREEQPILLHFVPEGKYYWFINVEYTIIDEMGRPREIGTFQIDGGNAERFNIRYMDKDGKEKYPLIIHTAIIGTIERYLYMIFDTIVRDEMRGEKPMLPLWLSPVQVRLIPVGEKHIGECLKIAGEFSDRMRMDVDDRTDLSVNRRIRDAERSWVPYILVVGDREIETGVFKVRRRRGKLTEMRMRELLNEVESQLEGYPWIPLTLPIRLSERPIYSYA